MQKNQTMNKLYFFLLSLIALNTIQAQDVFNEKSITENNSNYFKLERENIHTQFTKTVYTAGETIWLKGYVIDKTTGLPNIKSSNIVMEIHNSKGEKIDSKLLYSENSTFSGYYKIDQTIESGQYYFRFFTNYMNNFSEDESSTYEISIINPTNYKNNLLKKFDPNQITINYYPESGILLENTDNEIVVEIKDCNGLSGIIQNIEVVDDKEKVLTNFSTNQNGVGKFKLLEVTDLNYKIKIQNENLKLIDRIIEKPIKTGYIININDNYNSETLFVNIKTNSKTLDKKENIWLGIQYLNNVDLIKVNFDNNSSSKNLAFSKKDLSYGINNFVIVNEKKEVLSKRLYYNHNPNLNNNIDIISKVVSQDSIKYTFRSNLKLGEISYSILPSKTITKPNKYSIHSSFLINNNIKRNLNNVAYYLSDYNRLKHFELDNALYCTEYKYNFLTSFNVPEEKFKAEHGLTLTGKINTPINYKDYKVNLLSITSGNRITTYINEKNEFRFENLIVDDSTSVHLTLIDKKNVAKEFSSTYNLIKAKSSFFKPINITSYCPENIIKKDELDNISFPQLSKGTKLLDSISIKKTGVKSPKLTNYKNSAYLSSMVDGYKITDDVAKNFRDVITFLSTKGFDVATEGGQVTIVSRVSRSFSQSREPAIMVDNSPIADVNYLYGMRMADVDEIYINKRGYGAGGMGRNGVISIFTKKTYGSKGKYSSPSKNYICEGGFTSFLPFKSILPINFSDESFVNFGSFFWNAKTNTNAAGVFEVTLPKAVNENVIIYMEGINSSGLILSKTIDIKL